LQRESRCISSGVRFWDSGFEHHTQLNGQPLKKTVVRMPGPSSMLYLWMLNTVPVTLVTAAHSSFSSYGNRERRRSRRRSRHRRLLD